MQNKLVNHDLHYNYMKRMRGHQRNQKQKYAMPKYDQKPIETQSMHARMICPFERPIRVLFYTCIMDIQNGKITSKQGL